MNFDIIYLIAENLEPNPLAYYRLATVSKAFYKVFTSDTIWKGLNPYGVKFNLCKRFWEACDNDPVQAKITCLYWQDPNAPVPFDNNLFSWLGYLRFPHETDIPTSIEENTQLLRSLFTISGKSIAYCSRRIRNNRELVLLAIKHAPFLLDSLPDFMDDKEVVMIGLRGWQARSDLVDWRIPPLQYVSEYLRDDPEVVFLACKQYGNSFADASSRLQQNKKFVSEIIAHQGDALASSNFKDVREMVLTACKSSPLVLLASSTFVDDREIVMTAVSLPGSRALYVASSRLKRDRELVLHAIKSCACIPDLPPVLQDDKEIALALVASPNGSRLALVSPRLRDDPDVVYGAVTRLGKELKNANQRLQDDKTIVMAAISQSGGALEFASPRLRGDLQVVMAAIQEDPLAFMFASLELKETNRKLVSMAVTLEKSIFHLLPHIWRESRDLVKVALINYGDDLRHLPLSYRADQELVKIAVAQCGMAIRFAAPSLLENRQVVKAALGQDARVLNLLSEELKNDIELLKIAIKTNPMSIRYSPQFCDNRELALMAIEGSYRAYTLVGDALKNDYKFNLDAVRASGYVFNRLPKKMRMDAHIQESARVKWIL